MSIVLVSTNLQSALHSEIDFSDKEWSSLLPENLHVFRVEEIRRPCSAYTDGLFPQSKQHDETKQITRVQKFYNYIEYSKILSDEVVPISGQLFLTTKFYDRRGEGWASAEIKKKVTNEKDIVGYCINGDVYCAKDKDNVYKVFYGIVYKSLVEKSEAFVKLVSILKDGVTLNLIGGNEDFLKYFKDVLLSCID